MTEICRSDILNFQYGEQIRTYVLSNPENSKAHDHLQPLGEGGASMVFFARQMLHENISIPRAIKFFMYSNTMAYLTPNMGYGRISERDFINEIANTSRVNHENIVKIIDAGIHEIEPFKIPFIVTEFIDGPDLRDVIEIQNGREHKYGKMAFDRIQKDPNIVLKILEEICDGIQHLHEHHYYHCDIAPKNIFIRFEEEWLKPIIGDLSLCKKLDSVSKEESKILVAGTLDYMPKSARVLVKQKVSQEQFKELMPFWDLYGFAKTGLALLSIVPDHTAAVWKPSLVKIFNDCMSGTRYKSASLLLKAIRIFSSQQIF